ncbi:MAG: beta-lactamase family protein [Intrasporangium sp.]|uniref:serine hydrolase domain-containing protein n=1 Tax=Intrasporangium sp. TaxID=1925024 RepID=UPI002648152D|nr:serine hydrolase [Intrasporangium sp.]MDN5794709.1 beta-lactamase family protein [Intrasporangium sp.]
MTVKNWQDAPYNRWSFLHLREVIPTQRIPRGPVPGDAWVVTDRSAELEAVKVQRLEKGTGTVGEVLADTFTDAVLVVHDGRVVMEQYQGIMRADTAHLLMSVSKSLVGCVTGNLVQDGHLEVEKTVDDYVPEIAGSGYSGARVRDLLDMRTGAKFSETYKDPKAEVRVMERHMGWRPGLDEPPLGAYAYLRTLDSEGPHGGDFTYRSADTDVLGWVCERAAGDRMANLIARYLWTPMGAEWDADVTCDCVGTAIHDGGVSAVLRDLARFGQLLLDDGRCGDRSVVPAGWLRSARSLDPDIRAAFAASENEPFLPGGWYRNQFWFIPGPSGTVQLCLGIHGQMVLVDRETATVAVKYSTWPDPQNPAFLIDTIRAFTALGRHLSGLAGEAPRPGATGAAVHPKNPGSELGRN